MSGASEATGNPLNKPVRILPFWAPPDECGNQWAEIAPSAVLDALTDEQREEMVELVVAVMRSLNHHYDWTTYARAIVDHLTDPEAQG